MKLVPILETKGKTGGGDVKCFIILIFEKNRICQFVRDYNLIHAVCEFFKCRTVQKLRTMFLTLI